MRARVHPAGPPVLSGARDRATFDRLKLLLEAPDGLPLPAASNHVALLKRDRDFRQIDRVIALDLQVV